MSSDEMKKRNLEPMARIVSWSSAGVDPSVMGTGPIPASRKALDKAGWDVSDLDLIESNEAFAAQSCAVNKEMGWDVSKVNVNGGAIAIGHALGSTGPLLITKPVHELQRSGGRLGLISMCCGGGLGTGTLVERL